MQRLVLILGLALLSACGGDDAPRSRDDAPRPIVPFEVELAENRRDIQAVGTARARAAATVTAEAAGLVEEVLLEPGVFVQAGDKLVQLEADDERLAVNLAAVSVREAEQLLERYRRIEDTGAVSDSAIDEARTQLEAARIQLEQAQLRLDQRTITAPFEGFVGLTDLDPGARVTPDQAITSIDDRRVLFIDFSIPEDVFGQLSVGDQVKVTAFSEGDRVRTAEVVFVDSRIDPQARSFRVRTALDNSDDSLRPGMSFEVRFAVPGRRFPVVPEASIVWGSNGSYLWAVRDGAAAQIPVQIVSRRDGFVLVDGALDTGAIIVAEGVQKVREGTPVTLVAARSGSSGVGVFGG